MLKNMLSSCFLLAASCGAVLAAEAPAPSRQAGRLGVGILAGSPTALSVKYWASETAAFDGAFGTDGDTVLQAGAVWHAWDLLAVPPDSGRLGFSFGAGPRLRFPKDEVVMGVRTAVGAAFLFPRHPVELALELGPVFEVSGKAGVDWTGHLGLRLRI